MVLAILRYAQLVAIYSTVITAVLSANSTLSVISNDVISNDNSSSSSANSTTLGSTRSVTLDDLVSDPTPKARQRCVNMYAYCWSDFVYACSWSHGELGYNLLFKRWDESFVFECWCEEGLETYGPWNSPWSRRCSYSGAVIECYTPLGDFISTIVPQFDSVTCGGYDVGVRWVDTGENPFCITF